MTVLTVIIWAFLLYAFSQTLTVGLRYWLDEFTPSRGDGPGVPPVLLPPGQISDRP